MIFGGSKHISQQVTCQIVLLGEDVASVVYSIRSLSRQSSGCRLDISAADEENEL